MGWTIRLSESTPGPNQPQSCETKRFQSTCLHYRPVGSMKWVTATQAEPGLAIIKQTRKYNCPTPASGGTRRAVTNGFIAGDPDAVAEASAYSIRLPDTLERTSSESPFALVPCYPGHGDESPTNLPRLARRLTGDRSRRYPWRAVHLAARASLPSIRPLVGPGFGWSNTEARWRDALPSGGGLNCQQPCPATAEATFLPGLAKRNAIRHCRSSSQPR